MAERFSENKFGMSDVTLLAVTDQAQIIDLRNKAYGFKYCNESLNPTLLNWNWVDKISLHYGIKNGNGDLISAMRLTISDDEELFKSVLLYEFDELKFKKPFAILSRAASHPDYSNQSLNFIIRNYVTQFVFSKNMASQILGLVADDAKRLSELRERGYHLFENKSPWGGCIKRDNKSSYVICLNSSNYIPKVNSI